MKFSDLYQTYDAMREPNYVLKVGGKTLKIGDDARLIRVECQLTSTRQAGVLVLEAALDPKQEHGAAWLDAFQPGAMCSFSVGYGKSLTEVFCGFLYDVLWSDPLQGTILLLEAVFLDVRGRLMLTSCADAGAQRVMSQMIGDILGQSCCGELAKKKTIDPPPEDWDLPALRPGPSDYAILCAAADFLCYEFYAFADELYFGKPRPKTEAVLTFDGPNGLLELKRRRTLAGQCAAVAVGGTDDKQGPSETTTSIGRRCNRGDTLSRAVLIARSSVKVLWTRRLCRRLVPALPASLFLSYHFLPRDMRVLARRKRD